MILFHFTRPELLPAILREGLIARAGLATENGHLANYQSVVWLTARPSLTPTLELRRLALKRGILCGPRFRNLPDATVCLRTVIATADRKLKHLHTWLKSHPWPGSPDLSDPMIQPDWWFYKGDIPPARLSIFRHFPRGTAHWELPAIRERWLNGIESVFDPATEADLLAARAGPDDYIKANSEHEDSGDGGN